MVGDFGRTGVGIEFIQLGSQGQISRMEHLGIVLINQKHRDMEEHMKQGATCTTQMDTIGIVSDVYSHANLYDNA